MTEWIRPDAIRHSEGRIDVLSFHATAFGPKRAIDLVERLFPQGLRWSNGSPPPQVHQIQIQQTCDEPETWEVIEDDAVVHVAIGFPELTTLLAWLINSKAVEWLSREHLLFHAGAVAAGQAGIILPGQSGSGKSTLTAALVAQGFSYFSDEVAVIAAQSGYLLPFAKAIKLEPDSVPVLANHYPELACVDASPCHDTPRATYLRPPASAWPPAPVSPTFVVFPRYEAGARTHLYPIPRAEGFARLLAHSFNAGDHAAEGVQQIVRLLRGCASYDLTFGDLDDAVAQLWLLAAGAPESGSTSSSQASHRRFTRAAYRLNTECSHRQTS